MSVSVGNSQTQNNYEGLSDILLCYICMGKLKDAHMCPVCSKISCLHCIKKWMRQSARSDCPHCRTKLSDSDLINVRTVQELSDVFDMVAKRTTQDSSVSDTCSSHREQLSVYCVTCSMCICARCALWGEHRQDQGHVVKPLDELYKEQKEILSAELRKLNKRISEIVGLVEQVDMKIEKVKLDKGKTKQEIDTVLADIDIRLDDQARAKLQKLIDAKRHLKKQAHEISDMSAELEGKMNGSKSEFVLQGEELKKKLMTNIVKLQEGRKKDQEVMPDIGNFVNEVVPPFESAILEIKDFREKQRLGDEIYSPFLNFCGLSWRLKVYPNGNGEFVGKYLCMFVELCGGYNQIVNYHYSVELVRGGVRNSNRINNRNFKKDYSSDFGVGDLWGYKRFYELAKLESQGFLVNDTLVLKFSVRHPTYHQKCRDLVLYVNDLKHKIMSLKHQNYQLRQKCQGLKDVDDPPPPLPPTPQAINSALSNSSPAHSSSIKSSTGSNTQTSPAHSMKMPTTTTNQMSSAHSSHERSLSGGHLMFTASQPVSGGHFKDSSPRQPYHPLTPHAGLITPSSSNSTQRPAYQPHPSHPIYQQQQQDPMSGRYAPPPINHRGDQRRQSMDPNMYRVMEGVMSTDGHTFPKQISAPTLQDGGHYVLSQQFNFVEPQQDIRQNEGPSISAGFQDSPHGSQTDDHMQFTNEDYSTINSVSTLTGGVVGVPQGGNNSQLGSNYPVLSSQEHLHLMDGGSQKMSYYMYDMSQPDLLSYHQQRNPSTYRLSPNKSPQLNKRNDSSATNKRLSLTDLSTIQAKEGNNMSRSVLALHEDPSRHIDGGQKQRMNNLRPKSFHHSQGTLDMPLNIHGAPGLMSTMAARIAAPLDHSHHTSTLPRSMNRRFHNNARGGGGQVRMSRHPSGGQPQRQDVSPPTNHVTPSTSNQVTQPTNSIQSFTIVEVAENGRRDGPPPSDMSITHTSSQLTQEAQTPKLRSSGRRYTAQGKKRLGGIEGRATPTTTPNHSIMTQSDDIQHSSLIEGGGEMGGAYSRISVGQRTSSNTSLAAEII